MTIARAKEDTRALHRAVGHKRCHDQSALWLWPGVRRAGLPRQSPAHTPGQGRRRRRLDPDTGEVLPTWDQALDAITDQDQPLHVAQFGSKFDAQGVLAGSRESSRCIGYLTKHLGDCRQVTTDYQAAHAGRLADALHYEPCPPAPPGARRVR